MRSSIGKQTVSTQKTAPRALAYASERPECQPILPSADIQGPQYNTTPAFNFTQARAPTISMGRDDQNDLPPAATVAPMQQYPVDPFKNDSTGRQVLSSRPNTSSCVFSERPETMPVPKLSSYEGPAQFCREFKYGTRGVSFVKDTLTNDAEVQRITRRSFPIVDNGQLKQGRAVNIVHPKQQYPAKQYSSIGPQVLAIRPSVHAVAFSRRPECMPPMNDASDVGPASFPQRSSFNAGGITRLPVNLASETNTPMPTLTKVSNVSNHLVGSESCSTLAAWLKNSELQSSRDGNAAATLKITMGSKKEPSAAQQHKHALESINSLSDWLREFGRPVHEKEAASHPTKGRGHVAPTHVSKSSNPTSAAAAARAASLILEGKTDEVLKQRSIFHRRAYNGEGVMGVSMTPIT